MIGIPPFVTNEDDFATASLRHVVALAEGLGRTIVITRALVDSGRRVDLVGIEDNIGVLCAKALDLPPAEGREVRLLLLALRDEVDALSTAIRSREDQT